LTSNPWSSPSHNGLNIHHGTNLGARTAIHILSRLNAKTRPLPVRRPVLRPDAVWTRATALLPPAHDEHAPNGHHQCLPGCYHELDTNCLSPALANEAHHHGAAGISWSDALGYSLYWSRHVLLPFNSSTVRLGKHHQQPPVCPRCATNSGS
jgi:hypothetical protein